MQFLVVDTTSQLVQMTFQNIPVSLGTTTVAFKYNGGIIICGDSRTSGGNMIANNEQRKVIRLNDRIALAVSGNAAQSRFLTRIIREYIQQLELETNQPSEVKSVAHLYSYFNHEYKYMLETGALVAGIDNTGLRLFRCMLGGSYVENDIVLSGSGSPFIQGLIDEQFRPDMNKDQALQFAKMLIKRASQHDSSTNNMIRWMFIEQNGVDDNNYFQVIE